MAYVKKTNNANYSKRYTDQFRADAVEAYRALKSQGTPNAENLIAAEFGCSRASVTAWFRADREARRLGLTRPNRKPNKPKTAATATHSTHPHVALVDADLAEARREAYVVADVMADEAVSDHSTGGIHPTLTAYEDAAERYDHQKRVVDTLQEELTVHGGKLAELEQARDTAKKALQEIVNSL